MLMRFRTLKGAAIGATLMYYCDPQNGRGRRTRARDQFAARMRRARREAERDQRYRAGVAEGRQHLGRPQRPPADDRALADRIRSELGPEFPQETVVLTVVDHMAELRGVLPTAADVDALVLRVAGVADVEGVVDLLHVPGTPAPNKAAARLVSAAATAEARGRGAKVATAVE
jgi:hypothetical protein